jgi:ribulose-phosphate 3-epimerase
MERVIAPSILSADFANLGKEIRKTKEAGAKYLHFDVMDGIFVPSISFGMPVLSSIRSTTDQVLDVHLMIHEPIRYLEDFSRAGADIITIHYEACENVVETLNRIKELDVKAGVSIKPKTPADVLVPLLDKVDIVLVMTVEPGFGGQTLIPETLEKVKDIRGWVNNREEKIDIQVDGGIYHENVHEVLDVGANIIVSGSGIFRGDIEENVRKFLRLFK